MLSDPSPFFSPFFSVLRFDLFCFSILPPIYLEFNLFSSSLPPSRPPTRSSLSPSQLSSPPSLNHRFSPPPPPFHTSRPFHQFFQQSTFNFTPSQYIHIILNDIVESLSETFLSTITPAFILKWSLSGYVTTIHKVDAVFNVMNITYCKIMLLSSSSSSSLFSSLVWLSSCTLSLHLVPQFPSIAPVLAHLFLCPVPFHIPKRY